MTDCICSRMGTFAGFPNPITSRLGLWSDMAEDIDGNIWAECRRQSAESLCASAIFRCRKSLLHRKFPTATPWRLIRMEEFG